MLITEELLFAFQVQSNSCRCKKTWENNLRLVRWRKRGWRLTLPQNRKSWLETCGSSTSPTLRTHFHTFAKRYHLRELFHELCELRAMLLLAEPPGANKPTDMITLVTLHNKSIYLGHGWAISTNSNQPLWERIYQSLYCEWLNEPGNTTIETISNSSIESISISCEYLTSQRELIVWVFSLIGEVNSMAVEFLMIT